MAFSAGQDVTMETWYSTVRGLECSGCTLLQWDSRVLVSVIDLPSRPSRNDADRYLMFGDTLSGHSALIVHSNRAFLCTHSLNDVGFRLHAQNSIDSTAVGSFVTPVFLLSVQATSDQRHVFVV